RTGLDEPVLFQVGNAGGKPRADMIEHLGEREQRIALADIALTKHRRQQLIERILVGAIGRHAHDALASAPLRAGAGPDPPFRSNTTASASLLRQRICAPVSGTKVASFG